jgi:capsular exopolysaccharide synthesis family protein
VVVAFAVDKFGNIDPNAPPGRGDPMTNTAPMSNYQQSTQQVPMGAFTGGSVPPPSVPTDASRNIPTFAGLLNALKRRWLLACIIGTVVGCGIGLGVWLAMPKGKHFARALVKLNQDAMLNQSDEYFRRFRDAQLLIIKSRRLLTQLAGDPQVKELPMFREDGDRVRSLEGMISAKRLQDADDFIQISMNGDDSEQIRVILERLLFVYEKDARTVEEQNLSNKMKLAQQRIDSIDSDIAAYNKKNAEIIRAGLGGGTSQTVETLIKSLTEASTKFRTELTDLNVKKKELQNRIQTLNNSLKKLDNQTADPALLAKWFDENPQIKQRQAAVAIASEQMTQTAKHATPTSDAFKTAQRNVEDATKAVDEMKQSLKKQAEQEVIEIKQRTDLIELQRSETEIRNIEDSIKAREDFAKANEDKLERLRSQGLTAMNDEQELKPLRERREQYQRDLDGLRTQATSVKPVTIADDVDVKPNENLKQRITAALVGSILGFAGVLTLVSYLEWRSRKVDSVDQVMTELGMRVIGTIPCFPSRASLKAGGAEQNQNWRFILNESVNSTRTMLLHTAKTQSMQVIMVTSAMQGEGKTSLSSQLATSMATAGLRTLILDCDLRNPSIHRLFDVALTPGCSEILCQEVDVSDAVQPTSVPNLWMIPAGQCSNRVISALAQGHPLETLFNRLRGQFDFIVVDCCPVLPVADALLVGQHVDGVVFSILQDISQLPKVIDASERLTQLNIPLLGAVVNGIKVDTHAYGYNYVKQLPA